MALIFSLFLIAALAVYVFYQHKRYCGTKEELAKIRAIADRFISQTEVILNRPNDSGPLPLYQAHPWHGIPSGNEDGTSVNAFIELIPTDVVKPEVDKEAGHLRVTRPQKFSSVCPALYGFVPRTYCGEAVAGLAEHDAKRTGIAGDGDPLDICVLTECNVAHGNIFVNAVPIGGLRKDAVRQLAREAGLGVHDKPDSVEICFVPYNDHTRLVRERRPGTATAGRIVDTSGNLLGEHDGIERFTIGQRKGLGVAAGERRYVLQIVPSTNDVVLGGDFGRAHVTNATFPGGLTIGLGSPDPRATSPSSSRPSTRTIR